MDREALQRTISQSSSQARALQGRANYYRGLAQTTRHELEYKIAQLDRARIAKALCGDVHDCRDAYAGELDSFGVSISNATGEPEFGFRIASLADGMDVCSGRAKEAARVLVSELERECGSLQSQLASYEREANRANESASRMRRRAEAARTELDRLP